MIGSLLLGLNRAAAFAPKVVTQRAIAQRVLATSKPLSIRLFAGSTYSAVDVIKPEWSTAKKEGDKVPDVEFQTRVRIESDDENPFDWKLVTTSDLFAGKRVIVFSLPGAFTPTCSSTHVPGYDAAYDEIKSLGIDEIYCTFCFVLFSFEFVLYNLCIAVVRSCWC